MNQYVKVNETDTLNVLKKHIEDNYGYTDTTINTIGHKGYSDFREYEPDRVEFRITARKDLGLGIGISEITLSLNEQEAAAIIMKKLTDQGVAVTSIDFEKSIGGGYHDEGRLTFSGTKVNIKTLEDMKNIGSCQKVRHR